LNLKNDANKLLDHYDHYLGRMENSFQGKDEKKIPFMVLSFSGRESGPSHCLVTHGMSAHQLSVPGKDSPVRTELAVFTNAPVGSKTLGALLIAVGMHFLDTHASPGAHGILPGSGPVIAGGNPKFESFYVRSPVSFPPAFAHCSLAGSGIDILQLIPVTNNEAHAIACGGWAAFEAAAASQNIDLLSFDQREEVVF
jgi:hypothetical protein